ncbi:MAG TPA: amidohydrolase family protein [Acidimicrobiales bacterium]|nr:amidohydrolase family protein [Acidimicrobiales bacterium]
MARQYRLISADGHVIEPPDLWTKYLPKRFHERAPKLVKDPKGGDAWELAPGTPPMPLGLVTNAGTYGKRYEELEWYGATYESIRKGAFSGKARLDEQDVDGVDAEVIFPSQRTMGAFMAQEDDSYHLAGLEAYNTWMRDEFMAADPERLVGLAQMPGVDAAVAVKWLRDAKAAGFRGVIISAYPSGNDDLSADDDPFWEAAEEEQVVVHVHTGLRQAGTRRAGSFQKAAADAGRTVGLAEMGGPVGEASGFMSKLIYSGIFDRFPGLQMVAVECGVGWVPHFLEHMDDHYWRNRTWTNSSLELLPSDYFRRNWKMTFIREPFGVAVRHWIGVANLMWSTDYPHHRHDWPYSRRVVEESMGGVPEAEKRRMVCENAKELYRL